MSATRVLGVAGLVSAALVSVGGLADVPVLVGVAGLVMVAGNLYAVRKG